MLFSLKKKRINMSGERNERIQVSASIIEGLGFRNWMYIFSILYKFVNLEKCYFYSENI